MKGSLLCRPETHLANAAICFQSTSANFNFSTITRPAFNANIDLKYFNKSNLYDKIE